MPAGDWSARPVVQIGDKATTNREPAAIRGQKGYAMSNPNKQCRGIMRGVDKRTWEQKCEDDRAMSPELYAIMEAVGAGKMSIEDAVKKTKALTSRRDTQ